MIDRPPAPRLAAAAIETSPFTSLAAVEAWDTWFRWRDGSGLRDVRVDDTWERVAWALASGEEPVRRSALERELRGALASWRLLLDERVLAAAGTGRVSWEAPLAAQLNLAAFVQSPGSAQARLDAPALAATATLAVRALDIAAAQAGLQAPPPLEVGLCGLGDALARLGLPYAGDAAQSALGAWARCLSDGARRGAEQGPWGAHPGAVRGLTAIAPHPRLARFANAVADALDPLPPPASARASGDGATNEDATLLAQLRLRAAAQPWIDRRIAYPCPCPLEPNDIERSACERFARAAGLGPFQWRLLPPRRPRA